jgi:hypothetical protein
MTSLEARYPRNERDLSPFWGKVRGGPVSRSLIGEIDTIGAFLSRDADGTCSPQYRESYEGVHFNFQHVFLHDGCAGD